ncbi:MAG: NADH-quinone oxidoreductase subunit N [Planctomycetes bacterium]|nr:NADH-quinone oxidoreductase subunit N [Planctomycetota bacterium]
MTLSTYVNALLPELILMVAAVVCLFVGLSSTGHRRNIVGWLAFAAVAVAALVTVRTEDYTTISGLAIGSLTLYVRLIVLLVGAVLIMVNWYQSDSEEVGEYLSMILLSMSGVMLVASSNDLILLFFALELVSVPTYVLVALSRKDVRAAEACSKYFFLGALAAAITAYGLSFLYGAAGTTTMLGGSDSIAAKMLSGEIDSTFVMLGLLLTFGGLCFKIAAVPFHSYVGDVYQGAAAPLTAVLAFLPKLAGFIGLVKLMSLTNWELTITMQWVIWIVAAATMTVGNVLALMQTNIKRMLAYSSVAHSGFMLIGLLVGPVAGQGPFYDGVSAMLFYIAVYALANLGAFAVLTYLSSEDKEVEEQEQLAGLSRREPLAALALAICMFSLMGLPPTAGFWGKLFVLSSAFSVSEGGVFGGPMIWLAVIGVVNSAIAAAYYLRIVGVCYLQRGTEHLAGRSRFGLQVGVGICSLMMLALFIWPEPLLIRAVRATNNMAADVVTQYAERDSGPMQPQASDAATINDPHEAVGSVTVNVVP